MSEKKIYTADSFDFEDYFKEITTLPEEEVRIYGDQQTYWELEKLQEELRKYAEATAAKISTPRSVTEGGEDLERIEQIENQIDEKRRKIAASVTTIKLRALWPHEYEEVKTKTNEYVQSLGEILEREYDTIYANRFLDLALSYEMLEFRTASGDLVKGPFTLEQVQKFSDKFLPAEWGKVVQLHATLNARREISGVQGDAGFPGGASTPSE